MKFRYKNVNICKGCYEAASSNCTETIRQLELSEIKERCGRKELELAIDESFEVSRRIGNYLLVDDRNKKFCIPNNRMVLKEYKNPEIYCFDDIKGYEISCNPSITVRRLKELEADKKTARSYGSYP